MNLANKLTVFRILLVPAVMVFIYNPFGGFGFESPEWLDWSKIIAALLFFIAALTDWLDGAVARKYNLVTNFGKLMDPLADKFLVVGALIAITASESFADMRFLVVWVTACVFFRELAVTSVRLVAADSENNVIAASFIGKVKTAAQCICIMTILLESITVARLFNTPANLFSYITMAVMLAATVYSGVDYVKSYWKYIDPSK